jgi:hypothetical protein
MSAFTLTKEFVTPEQRAPGGVVIYEQMHALHDKGWDVVKRELAETVSEAENLVRTERVKRDYGKEHSYPELGGMPGINRDLDRPRYVTPVIGFPGEWSTYPFRWFMATERHALESDEVGFADIKRRLSEMLKGHEELFETWVADLYSRADGDGGSGSQLLAPDGGYMLDSGRPNPDPDAGTWDNLEAEAAFSEDAFYDASVNASMQIGPTGRLMPQSIQSIVIPVRAQKDVWKVATGEKVLGSNNNDPNWAAANLSYDIVKVYKRLTSDIIFYFLSSPKSDKGCVTLKQRTPVSGKSWWNAGENPDVIYSRIRSRWGLFLGDPRHAVRGGRLVISDS